MSASGNTLAAYGVRMEYRVRELEAEVKSLKAQLRETRSHTRHSHPDCSHHTTTGRRPEMGTK